MDYLYLYLLIEGSVFGSAQIITDPEPRAQNIRILKISTGYELEQVLLGFQDAGVSKLFLFSHGTPWPEI
jgi:hypothetical protein